MKKGKSTSLNFEIGGRCQYARRSAGYTQQQLAELLDVSVQYLSDMERGKTGMSTATIVKLCKTLGVSADFILLGEDTNIHSEMENALRAQKQMRYLSAKERKLIETIVAVLCKFFLASK